MIRSPLQETFLAAAALALASLTAAPAFAETKPSDSNWNAATFAKACQASKRCSGFDLGGGSYGAVISNPGNQTTVKCTPAQCVYETRPVPGSVQTGSAQARETPRADRPPGAGSAPEREAVTEEPVRAPKQAAAPARPAAFTAQRGSNTPPREAFRGDRPPGAGSVPEQEAVTEEPVPAPKQAAAPARALPFVAQRGSGAPPRDAARGDRTLGVGALPEQEAATGDEGETPSRDMAAPIKRPPVAAQPRTTFEKPSVYKRISTSRCAAM